MSLANKTPKSFKDHHSDMSDLQVITQRFEGSVI
jgi:hypothetical protein